MEEIREATTPTIDITVDIDLRDAAKVFVVFRWSGQELVKSEQHCVITEDSVSVRLSQEETLAFGAETVVEGQIIAKFHDGNRAQSNDFHFRTHKTLLKEVI